MSTLLEAPKRKGITRRGRERPDLGPSARPLEPRQRREPRTPLEQLPPYLRTPEAARFLGVSVSFLNHARLRGDGPIYKKLSPKLVVYGVEDLRVWVDSRTRLSTSNSRSTQA